MLLYAADTLVLRNLDHIVNEPTFTSAYTFSCCNRNDLPRISGGLWVLEPDVRVGLYMWQLMLEGQPTLRTDGTIDENVPRRTWEQSDMDLAMYTFRDWDWRNYPVSSFFLNPHITLRLTDFSNAAGLLP